MGTNYYWRDRPCEHCGRHEEIHVGKSSAGWSFSFRAYRQVLLSDESPSWGYLEASPVGFPVRSRDDWRKVFETCSGELWDEYGRQVDDPVAWLADLSPPTRQQRAWEDDQRGGSRWLPDPDTEWRDSEGFHFYAREFS